MLALRFNVVTAATLACIEPVAAFDAVYKNKTPACAGVSVQQQFRLEAVADAYFDAPG